MAIINGRHAAGLPVKPRDREGRPAEQPALAEAGDRPSIWPGDGSAEVTGIPDIRSLCGGVCGDIGVLRLECGEGGERGGVGYSIRCIRTRVLLLRTGLGNGLLLRLIVLVARKLFLQ